MQRQKNSAAGRSSSMTSQGNELPFTSMPQSDPADKK